MRRHRSLASWLLTLTAAALLWIGARDAGMAITPESSTLVPALLVLVAVVASGLAYWRRDKRARRHA
jgi:uncharacterized membrane protein YidH (DUF202 family)